MLLLDEKDIQGRINIVSQVELAPGQTNKLSGTNEPTKTKVSSEFSASLSVNYSTFECK